MTPDELLATIAATLRSDIAPAVVDEFARTQAFMAAVVLERVARDLTLRPVHSVAEVADANDLHRALVPLLAAAPPAVTVCLDRLGESPSVAATGPLVAALYDWGIDEPSAADALAVIRPYLRRDIDRRMAIAT